jgi:DNA-binding protein H-NS
MESNQYPWDNLVTNYDDFDPYEVKTQLETTEKRLDSTKKNLTQLKKVSEKSFDDLKAQLTEYKSLNETLQKENAELREKFEANNVNINTLTELEHNILTHYVSLRCKDVPPESIRQKTLRRVYQFLKTRAKTVQYLKNNNEHESRITALESCLLTTRDQLNQTLDKLLNV